MNNAKVFLLQYKFIADEFLNLRRIEFLMLYSSPSMCNHQLMAIEKKNMIFKIMIMLNTRMYTNLQCTMYNV